MPTSRGGDVEGVGGWVVAAGVVVGGACERRLARRCRWCCEPTPTVGAVEERKEELRVSGLRWECAHGLEGAALAGRDGRPWEAGGEALRSPASPRRLCWLERTKSVVPSGNKRERAASSALTWGPGRQAKAVCVCVLLGEQAGACCLLSLDLEARQAGTGCVHVRVRVCVHAHVHTSTHVYACRLALCVCACMDAHASACRLAWCVCVCVYVQACTTCSWLLIWP